MLVTNDTLPIGALAQLYRARADCESVLESVSVGNLSGLFDSQRSGPASSCVQFIPALSKRNADHLPISGFTTPHWSSYSYGHEHCCFQDRTKGNCEAGPHPSTDQPHC